MTSLLTRFELASSSTPPSTSPIRKVSWTLTHCLLIALALFFGAQSAFAQTETILYSFKGGTTDGAEPVSGLLMDSSGNLYGTTELDGAHSHGTAYELSLSGSTWSETGLYSFAGGTSDGANPYSGLVMDSSGNLYGTTEGGGAHSVGTFFELTPGSPWTESGLYSFSGGTTDGDYPYDFGQVAMDSSSNFYGLAYEGGAHTSGMLFKVSTSSSWAESLLFSMPATTGAPSGPHSGLIMDSSGNFYGTTELGGTHGVGTAFEVSSAGTLLYSYSFAGGTSDGSTPASSLFMDSNGNLYGTTVLGGTHGTGTVFEISPTVGGWTETVLWNFGASGDGTEPRAVLVMDSSGNLYGTTYTGGAHNAGIVFELSPSGGGWTETVLHSFAGGASDGSYPIAGVILDSSGNLYGTTNAGGSATACANNGCGTVYKLVP